MIRAGSRHITPHPYAEALQSGRKFCPRRSATRSAAPPTSALHSCAFPEGEMSVALQHSATLHEPVHVGHPLRSGEQRCRDGRADGGHAVNCRATSNGGDGARLRMANCLAHKHGRWLAASARLTAGVPSPAAAQAAAPGVRSRSETGSGPFPCRQKVRGKIASKSADNKKSRVASKRSKNHDTSKNRRKIRCNPRRQT